MNRLISHLRRLFCSHTSQSHRRNIYGDEINLLGGKRSIWKCDACGALKLRDEPMVEPCIVEAPESAVTAAEKLAKAEARVQAHRDADALKARVLERMRRFHEGIADPVIVKPRTTESAELTSQLDVYRLARKACLIKEASEEEIWVFPAGGCTEAQMIAVAKIVDAEGMKS